MRSRANWLKNRSVAEPMHHRRIGPISFLALLIAVAVSFGAPATVAAKKPYDVVAQTKRIPTLFFKDAPETGEGPSGKPYIDHLAIQTTGKHRVRRVYRTATIGRGRLQNTHGGWTPCCQRIYEFEETKQGRDRVIQVNVDGTGLRRFPPFPSGYAPLDISQRTGQVLLVHDRSILIAGRDGSKLKPVLTFPGEPFIADAAISRGGNQVAFFTSDPETDTPQILYVVNSDGSNLRQLWVGPGVGGTGPQSLEFSDQGARLAFIDDPDELDANDNPTGFNGSSELFLANTLGTGATQLTQTNYSELDSVFDPDAKRLAFRVFGQITGQLSIDGDIFVRNLDSGGTKRLTNSHNPLRFHIPQMWLDVKWQHRKRVK